jgi:hypothetical protein
VKQRETCKAIEIELVESLIICPVGPESVYKTALEAINPISRPRKDEGITMVPKG